jgi:hypothetical protein
MKVDAYTCDECNEFIEFGLEITANTPAIIKTKRVFPFRNEATHLCLDCINRILSPSSDEDE